MNKINIFELKSKSEQEAYAFFDKHIRKLPKNDDCIIKLSRSTKGIFVSAFCGGSDLITGFYQKINVSS
jgi:hypothetical protein